MGGCEMMSPMDKKDKQEWVRQWLESKHVGQAGSSAGERIRANIR